MSGSAAACEIVREAKEMGVEVYATDYYKTSPVKRISDKSFMVSTADVDSVVNLCRQEHVDGIFSGYTDSVLPYMQQVAEKLNLPFWGSKENIDICIDKMKFKKACQKAGLKTIPCIKATQNDYAEKILQVRCPVVVKPVDNSGSRGVYKCFDNIKLKEYCEKALAFSQKKEILIERLMDVNSEFSAYYMICGDGFLASMGDRYVDVVDESTAPQAKGMLFPSLHLESFIKKVDPLIRVFFRQNGMNNGFVFIQGFTEDEEFYINEIGYRLNGGFTYKFNEFYNGYNQVKELIRFSLTGQMDYSAIVKTNPYFNGIGLLITISLKEGVIGRIEGIEAIKHHPGILDIIPQHYVGDDLRAHGTSAQIFGYAFCVAKDIEELKEAVDFVRDNLIVEDTNHNNMLIGIIDTASLRLN